MKNTRLEKKLELKDFKLRWIKDISTAINENMETDELLDLFLDFLRDKLDISQVIFFSCANKKWELIGKSGINGKPSIQEFTEFSEIGDISVGDFKINGVKEAFEIAIPVGPSSSAFENIVMNCSSESKTKTSSVFWLAI